MQSVCVCLWPLFHGKLRGFVRMPNLELMFWRSEFFYLHKMGSVSELTANSSYCSVFSLYNTRALSQITFDVVIANKQYEAINKRSDL